MKKQAKKPFLGQLLQKLAPKIGARVVLEPEWEWVGQIVFLNGRRRYFRANIIDINTLGAAEISIDKDYANFFMRELGYPTVTGKTFFSDSWAKAIGSSRTIIKAYAYAQSLGWPVIVKPNSGSQGTGVSLVHNKKEFYQAMRFIFKHDKIALVQTPVKGKDYRIVVLDQEIISAYKRSPLTVVGDGQSSIRQLLTAKQKAWTNLGRDTQIKIDDWRIKNKLKHERLTLRSIPLKGARLTLLDNANLSTGGDSEDVTTLIHPAFKKLAISLTKDMGLRFCGVDLMIEGDISQAPKKYWVLEINAAPGLDHYVTSGPAQQKIVEDLYLKVLKSMGK